MHILLIEDDPNDVFLIKELLASEQATEITLNEAESINDAIQALTHHNFDLILLDLSLLDSQGIESFYVINGYTPSTPIIVLSGNCDQKLALAAVKAGAQDYLQKDEINTRMLLKVINYAIERKQIEEQLKQVSVRLHLALSAAKVGTWSIDLQTQQAYWDDYLHRLYGIEPGTFSGKIEDALMSIHPHDRARARQEIFQSINENKPYDTEHRALCPDGTVRILAKRGEVQHDASGNPSHLTGVCWDVTERKKAEQWFHKHRFELANAARINSMGEVATTLAHEINQPLAALSGFVQGCIHRIQSNHFDKEEILNALMLSSQQIERAGKIIERVESFAHNGSLIFELANINLVIEEACSLIYYDNDIQASLFKFDFDTQLPLAKIDKIQLQQVIINLINNSIEAFQISETNQPMIIVTTQHISGNKIEINIVDNGPGFSAELVDDIFKPYFTTKQNSVGIGLAICRTIIQAHGGTLMASLATHAGACMKITLPLK